MLPVFGESGSQPTFPHSPDLLKQSHGLVSLCHPLLQLLSIEVECPDTDRPAPGEVYRHVSVGQRDTAPDLCTFDRGILHQINARLCQVRCTDMLVSDRGILHQINARFFFVFFFYNVYANIQCTCIRQRVK